MGLDITAGSKLRRIADADEAPDSWRMYPNPDFADRADGLADARYVFDGDTIEFRAGSYGGYNEWREKLAELVGKTTELLWKKQTPGPFVELINFSDCEGLIGPKTAAKLAKDFADHQDLADDHPDDWFRRLYADWRKAFELASDNGAVDFH